MLINRGIVHIVKEEGPLFLGEGDFFGEIGALLGVFRTHDVCSYTHCHIYGLDSLDLEELLQRNPRSIESLIETMTKRMKPGDLESVMHVLNRAGAVGADSSDPSSFRKATKEDGSVIIE